MVVQNVRPMIRGPLTGGYLPGTKPCWLSLIRPLSIRCSITAWRTIFSRSLLIMDIRLTGRLLLGCIRCTFLYIGDTWLFFHCWGISASYVFTYGPSTNVEQIKLFIQYFARYWPWYSLRGLHIRITWFSLYGIRIPLFSLYGIYMPFLPYMVIQPIVLGMALLWAALDSSLSQWPLLWRHNDMTVIVSWNTRGRERDTHQRLDNTDARWLQTVNR